MSLMAATAVGLRLLERVEAIVDRERPELPTVQRKAIAAQLAYEWVNCDWGHPRAPGRACPRVADRPVSSDAFGWKFGRRLGDADGAAVCHFCGEVTTDGLAAFADNGERWPMCADCIASAVASGRITYRRSPN
jgi:hypothetical protein